MQSPPALFGRTVVIIGGTAGLGLSAAQACSAAGSKVIVVGRSDSEADRARAVLGSSAIVIEADAAHPQTAAHAIETAQREFGRFDGLYHVAGGSGRSAGDGPLHEISDAGWNATMTMNLTSLFYSNRAAARSFMERKVGGSVLNMGSVLGASPSSRYFSTHAYATAKAAIAGLTKASASFYAPHNIRFNVIAPGLVRTPMSRRASEDESILQFIKSKQPLDGGRIGDAADLDDAVVFFLSDQSKFVTGQVLCIDGGWSVTEGEHSTPPT